MLRWPNNQSVMGDDPPYLVVGTEVSAKYKGAFCEAKVRKVVRSVKCKVNFKVGGSAIVADDQVRGDLRAGSVVEAKHPDRKEFVEACITKIQDCSQYTVVFDDGDITTLRRTALCLKSGRHFAESETLDQLPLTHPEHFGNPVVGNRRGGRRSRNPMSDESSDEEEEPRKGKLKEEKEADIGKVVCVELGDKKKQKDNWFPGLVVHPAAQEVVRIRVKDEYLVRSFKDGRYFTVPKKEASEFTREIGSKVDNNSLKTAVDKALQYLDKDELPPHWDRELLFRLEDASTASDSDVAFDSDSSNDEPREEKDHFVAQLYKFMDDSGTPINRGPAISGKDVDLYKLFKVVHKLGGFNRVTNHNQWKVVSHKLGQLPNAANQVKVAYNRYLHSFEDFYRKLGCTMVNHPRGNRIRHRGGRSLIRDKDRATPINIPPGDGKDKGSEDTIDDDDDCFDKGEDSVDLSTDEKEDEPSKRREAKETENVSKLFLGPPPLERKPSDPQLKVITPRGKPKRATDGPGSKSTQDSKKKSTVTKVKGARAIDDDDDDEDDEMDTLDVEELEEDDDTLTTTRSKSKEELSKAKVDVKSNVDLEKKSRSTEVSEKRIKPSLTVTVEKKIGRPPITSISEKKGKVLQDCDRKTVRSLAADFEKKARGVEVDKKDLSNSDTDKKSRSYVGVDSEKKIKPSLTATLEKKKPSVLDTEKKNRAADTEKKVRPSLTADPERKKVRPSLTADPTKKVSRIDGDKKKEKLLRLSDSERDESDKKSKYIESDRKSSLTESTRLSSSTSDSDKKFSKLDTGDADKKGNQKSKKGEEDKKKQQVRKRKDDDAGSSAADDNLDLLPNYKNVCVGDKLKVYYGPTHESKVTYEAKVLEVEGDGQGETYLVHYTGWNNRYDEWIKRSRIADNVSWSPARAKRRHQAQLIGAKKSSAKRRTLTPARDGVSPSQRDPSQSISSLAGMDKSRDSQPPRSSTPSSVTSSSSRTKSPAMRPSSARVTRNTIGDISQQLVEQPLRRTRTRRISGQTDMVSESESDASESESEAEPSATRKSSRLLASERDDDSNRKDSVVKRKQKQKREMEVEADEDEEKDVEKDDGKDDDDVSSESPSEEKLPIKRTRKGTRGTADRKTDIKVEVDEEQATSSLSSKRRDLDLNQIRLELKGIEKATVKTPSSEIHKEQKSDSDAEPDPDIDMDPVSILDEKASTLLGPEESVIDMDDVYEFKEPEPFEFEVRTKREPSVERTSKLQKRPLPRIFDDVEPIIKKKVVRPRMGDSESSEEGGGSPAKKRFRQPLGKKEEFELKLEAKSPSPDLSVEKVSSEQATPQKKILTSSDDAFEKLRQSPSYRFSSGSPIRATTPTPSSLSPVSSPLQSPPHISSAASSVITSSSTLPINRPISVPISNLPVHLQGTKAIPVTLPKQTTAIPSVKITSATTSSAQKLLSSHESKSVGGMRLTLPSIQSASLQPLPSRPPVLAAAVKIPSEGSVITRKEDWLKTKPGAPEKLEATKDVLVTVKIEKDESLPPLVPTTLNVPLTGRSSPDPPQLLPMSTPMSKSFPEPAKAEAREAPMPQIKKESTSDIGPISGNSSKVINLPTAVSSLKSSQAVTVSSLKVIQPMSAASNLKTNQPTLATGSSRISQPVSASSCLKASQPTSTTSSLKISHSIPAGSSSKIAEPTLALTEPNSPVAEEQMEDMTEEDSPRKGVRRKAQVKRKKAVSKEFVEDSDSDSSDEGRRLVIDKSESSDSSSESTDLKPFHSSKDNESKWHLPSKLGDPSFDQQKTSIPDKDDVILSKAKDQSCIANEVGDDKDIFVKTEDIEEPEVDNNLCSLLCEETIPGSPAPPSDVPVDVHAESGPSRTTDIPAESSKTSCKVLEMPFASVPGNTRSAGPSTSAKAQFSKSSLNEKADHPSADLGLAKAGPSASSNEAAPVMDNTPPTTPDSSISTLSNSPRGEHGDTLSILDNDSSKSHRDSEDAENKDNDFSDDDIDVKTRMKKLSEKKESERDKIRCETDSVTMSPNKKRRRSRKNSESEDRTKRPRHSTNRISGQGAGSDSDDNTETSSLTVPLPQSQCQSINQSSTLSLTSSLPNVNSLMPAARSPRPSKYNFFVNLAPELDASQRIALLQQTLQELRKTYANVKQQLACIDRRRKKLRRREREARLEARKMMREERRQAREEVVSCS